MAAFGENTFFYTSIYIGFTALICVLLRFLTARCVSPLQVLLHVLFEHAAGYALFAVKEVEEIGMLLPQVP